MIYKGSNEKATHFISFSSKSSKSLAKFTASLSSPNWDLYVAALVKNMESEHAIAGNNTNFNDIPNKDLPPHTIFQAWTYEVKDVTNFKNAFEKLVNTSKPIGYIGMGDIVHGSDGANVWIFKTYANLSEAFQFGTKNDLEKTAYSLFYKEISEETITQSFTRKLITRCK